MFYFEEINGYKVSQIFDTKTNNNKLYILFTNLPVGDYLKSRK